MAERMNATNQSRTSVIAFVCLLAIFVFFLLAMIVPYMLALLMGGILALLTSPAYKFLLRKKYNPKTAALTVTLSMIVLVIVPLFAFTVVAVKQGLVLSERLSDDSGLSFLSISQYITHLTAVKSMLSDFDIAGAQARSGIQGVLKTGTGAILAWFSDLPKMLLQLLLSSLACFFLLIDGKRFIAWFMDMLFMEEDLRERLIESVQNTAISVVLANLAATSAQAVIVMAGFLALGVPGAFLAGGAAFILAWLPVIGPVPIWAAGAVYLYLHAHAGFAVAMVCFGMVASVVDNVVRPLILKGHGDMHPLVSLVAIFGGISAFGILGVFVGPLLTAIVISLLQVWPMVGGRLGVNIDVK
ncbi:MAG: hypothetical protein A3A86_06890 [Elusimicrobia bacterium RIFCSPLOWO2_01_FULL_60_11]|nr:MAG: hypothetical protein A3A86_06890 [Elusimicrobia bacterium RIFCSPLOWO2_01_FULL_60_11]